ncbi:OmpA family protein [Gynuella sp.]|uniref:OmpA family protein n=1 Tax=Gynuella sp. TaxID=2969146 RepID=UPI003D0E5555
MAYRHFSRTNNQRVNRWLVSYADFMTLLFAYFAFLFAISEVDKAKFENYTNTLVKIFDVSPSSRQPIDMELVPKGDSLLTTPENIPPLPDIELRNDNQQYPVPSSLLEIKQSMETQFEQKIQDRLFSVSGSENWISWTFDSDLSFKSGTAVLTPASEAILYELAKLMKNQDVPIQVEGHTDNQKVTDGKFRSNWELSAARAVAVVEYLQQAGIDPRRLSVLAYGEYQPIADNDKPQGRTINRRVVVQASSLFTRTESVTSGEGE